MILTKKKILFIKKITTTIDIFFSLSERNFPLGNISPSSLNQSCKFPTTYKQTLIIK